MFIALEGGEGAGKTTLAVALGERLRSAGRTVAVTREPGGTAAGESVRALLHQALVPWAETFAFMTARAQLVSEVISPALARGEDVICDRFAASTLAYQGYGRGLDLHGLSAVNAYATGGLQPDLVLYVDLPPDVGLARKLGEKEAIRTGLESLEFHRRVRDGYRMMAAADPERWHTLDGTQPAASVVDQAWAEVVRRTEPRSGGTPGG